MWSNFFIAFFTLLALIYFCGYSYLRPFIRQRALAVSLAPMASIFIFSVITILLTILNVFCSASIVAVCMILLAVLVNLLQNLTNRNVQKIACTRNSINVDDANSSKLDYLILALYFMIGIAAVGLCLFKNLDGPNSFFQGWDNGHHMQSIRTFLDTGIWSPLSSTSYGLSEISPYITNASGFYPSLWHGICALACSGFNLSVPAGINCINALLIGAIFPTSIYALLRVLTSNDRFVLFVGSLIAIAIPACPWDYIIYGPLYPNLLSTALTPLGMVSFYMLLNSISDRDQLKIIKSACFLLVNIFVIFLAHPNGIFSLQVLLIPLLVSWLYSELKRCVKYPIIRFAVPILLLVVFAIFWYILGKIPAFQSVVSVDWPAITSFKEAILDALLLGVVGHPAQPAAFALLVVGVISLIHSRKNRWLLVSYLITIVLYIVDAGTNNPIKHVLTGFWYTDYHRTGALVGLSAILIISIGGSKVLRIIANKFQSLKLPVRSSNKAVAYLLSALAYIAIAVLIMIGPVAILRKEIQYSPFYYQGNEIYKQNSFVYEYYEVLTTADQKFSESALAYVEKGDAIINNPNDGSAYLYPLYDAPMYYRDFSTPPETNENECSRLIRLHLNEIAYSREVQDAVKRVHAKYVIQLDAGVDPTGSYEFYNNYKKEDWVGINSIDENTPGFELVYKDNDMRLYRITAV